jgi:hypothetical protein
VQKMPGRDYGPEGFNAWGLVNSEEMHLTLIMIEHDNVSLVERDTRMTLY